MVTFLFIFIFNVVSFAIALKIWRALFETSSGLGREVIKLPLIASLISAVAGVWFKDVSFLITIPAFFILSKKILDLDFVEAFQLSAIWTVTSMVVKYGALLVLALFARC
jgi:hypothetical protein